MRAEKKRLTRKYYVVGRQIIIHLTESVGMCDYKYTINISTVILSYYVACYNTVVPTVILSITLTKHKCTNMMKYHTFTCNK